MLGFPPLSVKNLQFRSNESLSADKRDIAGGQAEEKETQMEMLKVMPATGLLMEIDNKKIVKLKHRH